MCLCICPSSHPSIHAKWYLTGLWVFFLCCLTFTESLYILCTFLTFFPVFVVFINLFWFSFVFVIASFLYSGFISGKRKIKIPACESQKVSLLSRFSSDQTLKHLHSSCLPESTGYHCRPETWLSPAWSLHQFLSVFLSRDYQILSSVSWRTRTGTFADTCSSASTSSAAATAKQTSELKLTENSSQTRADDHSISDEAT